MRDPTMTIVTRIKMDASALVGGFLRQVRVAIGLLRDGALGRGCEVEGGSYEEQVQANRRRTEEKSHAQEGLTDNWVCGRV
jgi:hypothetical protein